MLGSDMKEGRLAKQPTSFTVLGLMLTVISSPNLAERWQARFENAPAARCDGFL